VRVYSRLSAFCDALLCNVITLSIDTSNLNDCIDIHTFDDEVIVIVHIHNIH
jgi:hypothetical protein